jgi:rhodanese-related sulfurtransferase
MEWAETGLPEGAAAISLQDAKTLEVRAGFAEDVLRALNGRRDRPIALICARGNRSALATDLLAQAGFSDVHDISEGVIGGRSGPGWLARELPTEPCKAC